MKKTKIYSFATLLAVCLTVLSGCNKEEISTDQFPKEVSVVSYGPLPVMRGGQLRFIGTNLEQVKEVILPGVPSVTDIQIVQSGVPSEIRITVPKDGPEPGQVILRTSAGVELLPPTPISFSEPIAFESFSPSSVKPGEVVTLKGDYFNLIHEVVFSDEVIVSEKDFVSRSRYEIQVTVPAEARTGKIAVGDLDETDPENEGLFPNLILSEGELTVALPEVSAVSAERFKAGETITVSGTNLQFTASVKMTGAVVENLSVSNDGTKLTFVQPDEAQSGPWFLVTRSGVEIPAGELVCVVPADLAVAPVPVKAGATLAITGKDLDLVKSVQLPNAGEVEFQFGEALSFTVPASAQEGEISLVLINDEVVTVGYTLVKPVFGAFSVNPAAAGSPLTITGTDLDLVTSVTFGGDLKVDVENPSGDAVTVSVPTLAQSGVVKLNLANGTSVECEELSVDTPQACYILELPETGTEIFGGTVLIVPVANEDKLVEVQVNGQTVNYLLNGTTLYISLPDTAASGTVIALVSSNGTVEYTIDCIPNTIQKKVIWSGSWDCGSWAGNQDFAYGAFDWTTVEAGTKMVMEFTQDSSQGWWQIALRHGDGWGDLPENTFFDLAAGQTSLEVELTQAMLDDLIANMGLIITGCNYTLTKITLVTEISLEKDLAGFVSNMGGTPITYPYAFTWGDDGRFTLSQELLLNELHVKKGSVFLVYKNAANTGQVQINDSDWGTIDTIADWNGDMDVLEKEFDDAMMEAVNNGGFIIQGDLGGITKIAILP